MELQILRNGQNGELTGEPESEKYLSYIRTKVVNSLYSDFTIYTSLEVNSLEYGELIHFHLPRFLTQHECVAAEVPPHCVA